MYRSAIMIAVLFLFALAVFLALRICGKRAPKKSAETCPESRPNRRAYVLGVNYAGENASDDEGCWKVVADYAEALGKSGVFEAHEVLKYVNDRAEGKHYTSKPGMQRLLTKIAARSYVENVHLVHVHFCGSGGHEGIETSDGDVVDTNWLITQATSFSPGTRVVMTFDCAFEGTLPRTDDRAVTFVSGDNITHALLDALTNKPWLLDDVTNLCAHVADHVGVRPVLSSTHDVTEFPCFMPVRTPA